MNKRTQITWSADQLEFLRANVPGNPWQVITETFNTKFKCARRLDQIKGYCKRNRILNGRVTTFQKGHAPSNKGIKALHQSEASIANRFKAGSQPYNTMPVGTYRQVTPKFKTDADGHRVMTSQPYWRIKVAETIPTRFGWRFLHQLVWEGFNGPLPAGHAVVFIDGDIDNMAQDNLECITRGELAALNKRFNWRNRPVEYRATLIMMARVETAISKRRGVSGRELKKLCAEHNMKLPTVVNRINRGWSLQRSLTEPLQGQYNRST